MASSEIILHGAAEAVFTALSGDDQASVAMIYPWLSKLARNGKATTVDDRGFPVVYRYAFRGLDIEFFCTGVRTVISDVRPACT